jgi:hypothetical protein
MRFYKPIAVVFLSAIMMIPLLTPALLQLKQFAVQIHMLEELEKQQLCTITVPSSNIIWIKKGKECLVEGELFDVKEIQTTNGIATLKGLFDVKEKQLKKQIEDFAKKEQQSNKAMQFVKSFSAFTLSNHEIDLSLPLCTSKEAPFVLYNRLHCSPFIGLSTPPPKI